MVQLQSPPDSQFGSRVHTCVQSVRNVRTQSGHGRTGSKGSKTRRFRTEFERATCADMI